MRFINTNDSRDYYEVPETDALRKGAEGTIAWITLQEHEIDKLMVDVIPELLTLHYSDEFVLIVEKWLLDNIPDLNSVKKSKNAQKIYMLTIRYFAEVLCQRFEAEWIIAATENKLIYFKPQVLLPFGVAVPVFEIVDSMIVSRVSDSFSHNTVAVAEKRYADWVASSRPQKITPLGGERPTLAPFPEKIQSIINSWKKRSQK